jgi:hypothetical protein
MFGVVLLSFCLIPDETDSIQFEMVVHVSKVGRRIAIVNTCTDGVILSLYRKNKSPSGEGLRLHQETVLSLSLSQQFIFQQLLPTVWPG